MKHLSIVFTLFYCSSLFSSIEYPETPQHPVTLQFPGCQIVDPYLWLEEDSDPAVQQWEEEQHALTEQYFSQNLFIPLIEKRLHALQEPTLYSFQAGESSRIITVERPIEKEQPIYYIQEDEESERLELLDVSQLGPFTTIEETEVSPDGRYFAYSITERGNEKPLLKVIDLDTLTPLDEPLSGSFQTNLAWHPNSKGFFYTTFPKGEFYYHQTVLYHEIGSKKEKLILCEQKKTAWFYSLFSEGENLNIFRACRTKKGLDHCESYLLPFDNLDEKPKLSWSILPNKPMHIPIEINKKTYYLTNDKAPNFRIVKKRGMKEFIPESKDILLDFCQLGKNFAATYRSHGHTIIKIYNPKGKFIHEVPLPGVGMATLRPSEESTTDLFFESMAKPRTIYKYDSKENSLSFYHTLFDEQFNANDFETSCHLVKSQDGAKVPLFLTHKKGLKKNGKTPVVIYAYGGFNFPMTPSFDPKFIPWVEADGIVALACLRGGSEYGQKWHLDGMREKKQNTFDDCIATAEWLIQNNYTDPSHLSIYSRSNGGLLVGAVVTQRPDLFKAAFSGVALLDMLRYDLFPLGALWTGEYGHPQNRKDFPTLMSYSPYHYPLNTSVPNPSILFIAGKHDYRVHPMHMRKMAARMQTAYPDGNPILYYNDPTIGHLFCSAKSRNRFSAQGLGFLMEQVDLSPATPSPKKLSFTPSLTKAKKGSEFLKMEAKHNRLWKNQRFDK